jgi:hypothetical protein
LSAVVAAAGAAGAKPATCESEARATRTFMFACGGERLVKKSSTSFE